MSDIYGGSSEGVSEVINGYVDYAKEVITSRAIPDMRDGCKPVTRRILFASHKGETGHLRKCSGIVTDIMKIHPHGDSSVYGAFVLLTDANGSCNVPFFKGSGNLGRVYSSAKPAAYRYPLAKMNENGDDFFTDSEVIKFVPTEDGDAVEPTVLPARYPIVLVNGSKGIAVSTGTSIPSFNLIDVLDLTCKCIKGGGLEIDDAIVPDFPTGGVLVRNDEELAKIMLTGKGKLKVRAKVEIEGKEILVKELPYDKTAESIVKVINDRIKDIQGLTKCYVSIGRNSRGLVTIVCKSKNAVEDVLMSLYRMNILQSSFSSNILVIEDEEPKILGVYGIIESWLKWRRGIATEKCQIILKDVKSEKKRLSYFMRLVGNEEWKDEYVRRWTKVSKASCREYLLELFSEDDIDEEAIDWIYNRRGSSFNRGGKYADRYETLIEQENFYEGAIKDIDTYIYNELQEIKESKLQKGIYSRKTEVTYKDYKFSKISDTNEIEDTSFCIFTLRKDGFLTKTRSYGEVPEDEILCEISGYASMVLIGFDNFGRVVRVLGKEIPFTPYGEKGTYLPKYFDATFEEDYKVLYLSEIDGSRKMLVYRDGYVGFFDTEEFVGKRNTKAISNGVCLAVRDKLLHVYEEDEIPDYILLADDSNDKLKMGIINTSVVPVRSRLSRAKVLNSSGDIDTKYLKGFEGFGITQFISDPNKYVGKLRKFNGEFYGDPSELLDGDYLELCQDFDIKEN